MATKLEIYKSYLNVLEGQRSALTIDIEVLTDNPTSIPGHTNFTQHFDELITKLTDINDKISTIKYLIKVINN
mgnify:FL=1